MSTAVLDITSQDVEPGTVHYVLSGRFDAHETPALRALVDGAFLRDINQVILDLRQVNFIDSSGLSELVRTMKGCRESGGDLIIDGVSDAVRVILELTKLDAAFTLR